MCDENGFSCIYIIEGFLDKPQKSLKKQLILQKKLDTRVYTCYGGGAKDANDITTNDYIFKKSWL